MNRKKRINSILIKNFTNWNIEVQDVSSLHKGHNNFDGFNETHFCIILNPNFKNKDTRLSIQRKINDLLSEEFNSGLHSIEIKIIS